MSTPVKTVAFQTLGCKLNYSETSTISRDLIEFGYEKVSYNKIADVYVINTCSVTENADREARKLIRQAKSRNPNSIIAVIGCYAQLKPDNISSIEGVNLVLGTADKFKLLEYLEKVEIGTIPFISKKLISDVNEFRPSYSIGDRTRTYLKIQDGCDYNCSFCTIPIARGKSRNESIKNTIEVAKKIVSNGIKEIVLTGVNIGDFGKSTGESFKDLIARMDELKGLKRVRMSSIEPNLISDQIIELCNSSKKFMPHYHIPLQSGSDTILKSMKRRYNTELYLSKIKKIKDANPATCIGADVIVGYPNESKSDFLNTYEFISDLDISYLHVFPYSRREGTQAINIENPVSNDEKSNRSKMLRVLSDKKRFSFNKLFLGSSREVLFENQTNGKAVGYTDNYIKVEVPTNQILTNRIKNIKLMKCNGSIVSGSL